MAHLASRSEARQLESLFEGGAVAGLTDRQLLERFLARRDAAQFLQSRGLDPEALEELVRIRPGEDWDEQAGRPATSGRKTFQLIAWFTGWNRRWRVRRGSH